MIRAQGRQLPGRRQPVDLIAANQHGQQLYLANLFTQYGIGVRYRNDLQRKPPIPAPDVNAWKGPVTHRQTVLFDMPRDLRAGRERGFPPPADPLAAAALAAALDDYAAGHGWSRKTLGRAHHGLKILLATQDTPGAPLKATDIYALRQLKEVPVRPLLDACEEAGVVENDRTSALTGWFGEQISSLPEPMTAELLAWFRVMTCGSLNPPRRRPRAEVTIRVQVRWIMPTVRAWAAAGHTSLREISRNDVQLALPPSGNPRSTLGQGLRSIFTVPKSEKVIFTNPIAGIATGGHEMRYPLPAKLSAIREGLDSPNPACALITALVAFHGLRTGELRHLMVTDIVDGRLHLNGRLIPLADPVRVRLAAYLDERARRWPHTANPYLFIHQTIAGSTRPFGGRWLGLLLPVPVRIIREDRILHEIHATGGDVRRVCDLFGLTVAGAMRYAATLDPPGLTDTTAPPAGRI